MQDIELVQTLEPHDNLNEYPPNVLLLKCGVGLLLLYYFLVEVTIVRELHNNATLWKILPKGIRFNECMFVSHDVRAFHGGQDTHLVQGILLFLLGQIVHFDFL